MKRENGLITLTEPNEIFVFGSNREGFHGAGGALYAARNYGAVYGQGRGLQGRSYAIDTMSGFDEMASGVEIFLEDARSMMDMTFIVTPIGCGIAGYAAEEVAPLFDNAPDNVVIPIEFGGFA